MTKIREGYKETEIGVIPKDWEVVYLGSHTLLIDGDRGKNYPSPNEIVEDGILFLTTSNIKDNKLNLITTKFITQEKFNKLNKGKLNQRDLIITLRGTLGSIMIFETDKHETAFINAQMMIIRPKELIDYKFLYQTMISNIIKDQILKNSSGSAQPQLTKRDVMNLSIPLPIINEQQRIAEILSKTDEHIEKLDKTIEDYQLLKEGMMRKLLTEGIGHTEFKDTEIGRIPREWEVKELGEIGEIITGSTPKTSESENYGTDYCFVSPADLGEAKYITDTIKKLTLVGFEKTRILPKGTILVTCIGSTIGKMGILGVEYGSTNQQINSIICNKDVDNNFLYYAIRYNFNRYVPYISTQAIPIINKTVFSKFNIIIPPLSEQKQIADILSSLDNKIELYQNQKQDFIQLKKALMEKLLTGKIRTI